MKKIQVFLVFMFTSMVGVAQCPDNCDAILLLGFNEYQIYIQNDLTSAYAEMFTKSDVELDEISNSSSSGSGAEGKYKLISATWSKNKNNQSWRKRFNESREAYQKSGYIDTGFIEESSSRTVNNETVVSWQKCKSDLFRCIELSNSKTGNSSFATQLVGDVNADFTLIIHFIPKTSGDNKPTKISSVSYSPNLVPREPTNLKKDEIIQPYTGLSQSFTRVNKDKTASITVNIEGSSAINVDLRPDNNASSGVPVGTVIASTLTYAELCQSLGEQITFNVKNTWAPADGRSVSGSIYGGIRNSVPDLRGIFLRGLNKFYPDNNGASSTKPSQLDVASNRSAGDFQSDATKIPEEATTSSGSHTHTITAIRRAFIAGNQRKTGEEWSTTGMVGNTHHPTTESSGEHTHKILGGAEETRPKNVAVYYYIKIN